MQDIPAPFFCHMSQKYTYQTVLQYANNIVSEIGVENLYTLQNQKFPSAPLNYLIKSPKLIIPVIKNRLKQLETPKTIHLLKAIDINAIEGLYADIHHNLYIVYSDKLSESWQRFTIVKELCSAYTAHYQDKDIKQEVRQYIPKVDYSDNAKYERDEDFEASIEAAYWHKVNYVNKDFLYPGDLDSETFAILLATEIMICRQNRNITEDLMKKQLDGEVTLNDIAKSLMIPETILRIHMAKGYL